MNKFDKKTIIALSIAVSIIIILVIILVILKISNNNNSENSNEISSYANADEIVLEENDSNEEKEAKLQKKLELIDNEINEIQLKLNEKQNNVQALYTKYNEELNRIQNQPGENVSPEVTGEQTNTVPAVN